MIKHRMGCLTNILQNRRKRISAKLLDDGTRHGHTLSQPTHIVGQPSACQRNAIQNVLDVAYQKRKKGRREGRGVGGDRLESPVETHSMFVVFFFACVVVIVFYGLGGGGKLLM